MDPLFWLLHTIQDFVDQGGPLLWVIFGICTLLWLLILERVWYLRITWPRRAPQVIEQWNARADCRSWRARKIREATVSEVNMQLHAMLPLIRMLVALCPLLGLLGTVVGMLGVFEVIAVSGNDDAQAMARGVYRATIPTMAGLVVALTGIYFSVRLGHLADIETSRLLDRLPLHEHSPHPPEATDTMTARRHLRGPEETELDMTPMLDIVFIMLIFFIVTTSFVKESGVTVSTPQAESASQQESANIFIAITAAGEVWIDRRPVDPRAVRAIVARLHADNPEGSVIIQSDEAAATGTLVDVMDQVRMAGIEAIAIAADKTPR